MINIDIYQPVFYVNSEYIHDYSILQCGYQTVEAGSLTVNFIIHYLHYNNIFYPCERFYIDLYITMS